MEVPSQRGPLMVGLLAIALMGGIYLYSRPKEEKPAPPAPIVVPAPEVRVIAPNATNPTIATIHGPISEESRRRMSVLEELESRYNQGAKK